MAERVLVTGGGGFLGRAIVDRLLECGARVRSFSRGEYPDLAARGVEICRADLSDARAVRQACDGVALVFHVAAKPGIWGAPREFFEANVRGTEHIVDAALEAGVERVVFTSSPSVVFDGRDMQGVDESVPYPRRYAAEYPRTKAIAEQIVLAANGSRLRTVALRPHLIWGPGDNHLVPRILARGRTGRLRRIGRGNPLIDSTYIDNAADAHVLAADRLREDASVAGRSYFISNGEPWPLWELVNGILAAAGLPPVTARVPYAAAWAAGAATEALYRLLGIWREPVMTRFLADELATSHWFDISAARRDLGYEPRVSIAEGLVRLREWLGAAPAAGMTA